MKTKSDFLKRLGNSMFFQTDLTEKKRSNVRGSITTHPTDVKRIIMECYGRLCAHQFETKMKWIT